MIALVIILGGGWYFFHQTKTAEVSVATDPFANIVIPDVYATDPATKQVIQNKIDLTKKLYMDKPNIWETWIAIGNLKSLLQDYPGAVVAYQKSLDITGNNLLGNRNIAMIYDQNIHDYAKAEVYYRAAIKSDPTASDLYIALAEMEYQRLQRPDRAESVFLDGLAQTSNNPELWSHMIAFYQATGNTTKYAAAVRALVQAYPNNQAYRQKYADVLGSK